MCVIEVMAIRAIASRLLDDMREWLDGNDCQDARFETKRNGMTMKIKIRFDRDDLAERFRRVFRGSYSPS